MERVYSNGINFELVTESDGWVSIYKIENGRHIPMTQACDMNKAKDFCYLCEPINFPMEELVPRGR